MSQNAYRAVLATVRIAALTDARDAALRQIQLASIVGYRPTDFEKGVLSTVAAIDELVKQAAQS